MTSKKYYMFFLIFFLYWIFAPAAFATTRTGMFMIQYNSGEIYNETKFRIVTKKNGTSELSYDFRHGNLLWKTFKKKIIVDRNTDYLAFLKTTSVSNNASKKKNEKVYPYCLYASVKKSGEYQICSGFEDFIFLYERFFAGLKLNGRNRELIRAHQQLIRFLKGHDFTFKTVRLRTKNELSDIARDKIFTQASAYIKDGGIFIGESNPYAAYKILKNFQYKNGITVSLGEKMEGADTVPCIVKTGATGSMDFAAGALQANEKIKSEALNMVVTNMFSRTARLLDLTTWNQSRNIKTSLVMEHSGTDLEDFYSENSPKSDPSSDALNEHGFTETTVKDDASIVTQIFMAVAGMHRSKAYHLDLKAENIAIIKDEGTSAYTVKLIDFGEIRHPAFFVKSDSKAFKKSDLYNITSYIGTTGYFAQCGPNPRFPQNELEVQKKDAYALAITLLTTVGKKYYDHGFTHPKTSSEGCRLVNGFRSDFDMLRDDEDIKNSPFYGLLQIIYQMTEHSFDDRITVARASSMWRGWQINYEAQAALSSLTSSQ